METYGEDFGRLRDLMFSEDACAGYFELKGSSFDAKLDEVCGRFGARRVSIKTSKDL